MVHGRFRIVRAGDLVHAAVAVLAARRRRAGLGDLGVGTAQISIARVGMAPGALDLLRRRVMDEALHVLVAIDAGEHGAVDGVLQLGFIDKQALRLAVDVLSHGGVRVAGKTVRVFDLRLGMRRGSPKEQG